MKTKKIRVLKNFIKESIEKLNIDTKLQELIRLLEESLKDNLGSMFYLTKDLAYYENDETWQRVDEKTYYLIDEILEILEIEEGKFDLTENQISNFRDSVNEILSKLINDIVNDLHTMTSDDFSNIELKKHQIIINTSERIINSYRFNLVQDYVGKKRVESYIEEENPAKKIVDALSKEGKVSKDQVDALIYMTKKEYESNIASGDSHAEAKYKLEEYLKLFYEFD